MFDLTERCACQWTYILRPFPPRLVGGPAYTQTTDVHNLKLTFVENAHFIRSFKPFQYHLKHHRLLSETPRRSMNVDTPRRLVNPGRHELNTAFTAPLDSLMADQRFPPALVSQPEATSRASVPL